MKTLPDFCGNKKYLIRTMGECRDVTDQYQTGRVHFATGLFMDY
ncbi:hypothetical protein [Holdemanella sp.]|nr:hypothetical protein [Holdemanella sp.]